MTIKFFYNGLKVNGGKLERFMAWERAASTKSPAGIAIHARDYTRFSDEVSLEFSVENATDSQTDYFERDHFFVPVDHARYAEVKRDVIDAKARIAANKEANKGGKLAKLFKAPADTTPKTFNTANGLSVSTEALARLIDRANAKAAAAKALDLEAKGLECAAEYLRLYGLPEDQTEVAVTERTYADLY